MLKVCSMQTKLLSVTNGISTNDKITFKIIIARHSMNSPCKSKNFHLFCCHKKSHMLLACINYCYLCREIWEKIYLLCIEMNYRLSIKYMHMSMYVYDSIMDILILQQILLYNNRDMMRLYYRDNFSVDILRSIQYYSVNS